MEKEEILKAIMELPRLKANNPISAMVGISVDELMSAVDRFDKIPTYDELLRENKKQKEIINKLYKKCKTENASYDFDVWMKLNDSWKTLDDFAKHIKYNLHPIITDAYRCDIKNSINQIIEITKNDVVLKEDILEILENKGGLDTDGFKDQCDICNKFDYLVSIDNKCLCTECCKKQNIKNNKKISKKEQKQLNLFEFS